MSKKSFRLKNIINCKNKIGESCFWDPRDNHLWWTDISSQKILKLNPDNSVTYYELPERACFILPRMSKGFVIGFPNSICLANEELNNFEIICKVETDIIETRVNDAKVDHFGGIVFGTYNENPNKESRKPNASVYRLSPSGELKKLFDNVTVSNGIAFSKSGDLMYFADTPTNLIRRFKIDKDFSSLIEINSFDYTKNFYGFPDGGTVDNQDNYWSARVRGGCILSIGKTGEVYNKIVTPSKTPTCLTFGGENLDQIYVTSLTDSNSNNQYDGNLFIFETNIKGNPQKLSTI